MQSKTIAAHSKGGETPPYSPDCKGKQPFAPTRVPYLPEKCCILAYELSGLSVTGSIGILLRAKREGYPLSIITAIQKMLNHNIRLSQTVIDFAVKEAGENSSSDLIRTDTIGTMPPCDRLTYQQSGDRPKFSCHQNA